MSVYPGRLAALILLAGCTGAAASEDIFPQAAAAYLVLIQGEAVWGRAAARPVPPASLTKLMTAVLALESPRLEGVATVTVAAARETGTRLGLRQGERLQARALLAATVVASANDACHALVDHIAGNEARFVVLMNRRAAEMGLARTRFTNACGHDGPGHLSTASDLAELARTAMRAPEFAALVKSVSMIIHSAAGRTFLLRNTNELVGRYPGAFGIKTGYTPGAGPCVIAVAERDGHNVLLVLLNAPDRWWTAVAMLDRAFERALQRTPPRNS